MNWVWGSISDRIPPTHHTTLEHVTCPAYLSAQFDHGSQTLFLKKGFGRHQHGCLLYKKKKKDHQPVLSQGDCRFVMSGSREQRPTWGCGSLRKLCCSRREHGWGTTLEGRGQDGVSRQECGEVNTGGAQKIKIRFQK